MRRFFPLSGILVFISFLYFPALQAQLHTSLNWSREGNGLYIMQDGAIMELNLDDLSRKTLASEADLTPPGKNDMPAIKNFSFSPDYKKILLYTNARKVWRYETRGDYWVYDMENHSMKQLGKSLPASSLMFAKISPDGKKAAYVSGHNIYVEDLTTQKTDALTRNGSRKMINGTFDWVYEEEFDCRDGFRWSPDSRSVAYWQINDSSTRDYYMINTTDSVYSQIIPVEYPVAGQMPSPFRIGVADIATGQTRWMKIPVDAKNGTYLPRMEWTPDGTELIVQRLNRSQNESDLLRCNAKSGAVRNIFHEKDSAWIDIISEWDDDYQMGGWDWLEKGASFLWPSEKDGWRHLYRVSSDGQKETLVTRGQFDVMKICRIDEKNNLLYFIASPHNATQAYLYRCPLDGSGMPERITPMNQPGTHEYEISPDAKHASNLWSNYYTRQAHEWISLPDHRALKGTEPSRPANPSDSAASDISFFRITTAAGVTMDAWMQKPKNFDSTKKYPALFYVYTEPGSQTVLDKFGVTQCKVYPGDLARDGYIYISIDNRGTPAPKGAAWRKSIYRKIGRLNIEDQAQAAREILKWPFVDSSRIAVWGWSGGGSATLNLLFQHPELYKTGIAIAALGNLQTYDNIYEERYMGNPLETREDYIAGSPITHTAGLRGNLLYIHGSGDDNVHYDNAEMLLNELIRNQKNFQFMEYPNRTHNINEGPGTTGHLQMIFRNYLNAHCPGGAK